MEGFGEVIDALKHSWRKLPCRVARVKFLIKVKMDHGLAKYLQKVSSRMSLGNHSYTFFFFLRKVTSFSHFIISPN